MTTEAVAETTAATTTAATEAPAETAPATVPEPSSPHARRRIVEAEAVAALKTAHSAAEADPEAAKTVASEATDTPPEAKTAPAEPEKPPVDAKAAYEWRQQRKLEKQRAAEAARAEFQREREAFAKERADFEARASALPPIDLKAQSEIDIIRALAAAKGVSHTEFLRQANILYSEENKPEASVRRAESEVEKLRAELEADRAALQKEREARAEAARDADLRYAINAAQTGLRAEAILDKYPALRAVDDAEIAAFVQENAHNGTFATFAKANGRTPYIEELADFLDKAYRPRYDRITSGFQAKPAPAAELPRPKPVERRSLTSDGASARATSDGKPRVADRRTLVAEITEQLRAQRGA